MKERGLTNEKETPRMDFTKGFFNEKKMDNYFSHKFPRSIFYFARRLDLIFEYELGFFFELECED
jgi:hypothetical protein